MNKLISLILILLVSIAQAEKTVVVDYNNFKVGIIAVDESLSQSIHGRGIGALKLERTSPNSFTASLVNSQGETGLIQIEKTLKGNLVKDGISVTSKQKVLNEINFSRVSKSELFGEILKHGFGSAGFLVLGGIAVFLTLSIYGSIAMVFAGASAVIATILSALITVFLLGFSGVEAKSVIDTARLTSQVNQLVAPIAEQSDAVAKADIIYIRCDDSFNAANTRMSCSIYKKFAQTLIELSDN